MVKRKLTEGNNFSTAKRVWLSLLAALIILSIGFSICIAAGAIGYRVNTDIALAYPKIEYASQLIPEIDTDGSYYFTSDSSFKILQITDVHIGGGFMTLQKDGWAINAVATMISVEKPDLVILTGDIAYPVGIQTGSFNNLNQLKMVAQMMEKLGVYWTMIFGNHDAEEVSTHTKQDLCDYLTGNDFKYCLFQEGPTDIDGKGNHCIKVKNNLGLVTHTLYMLDSHSYREEGGYDNVKQNQVDWYGDKVDQIIEENGLLLDTLDPIILPSDISPFTNPNSLLFLHIPLREYEIAWEIYSSSGNTSDVNYIYGGMKGPMKPVNCGEGEDDLFETALSLGSTTGIFCGHDHLNNFQISYKGIRLTYGMSIDYTAFTGIHRQGSQRGCTIIRCQNNGTWASENSNFYQAKYDSPARTEKVIFN